MELLCNKKELQKIMINLELGKSANLIPILIT
jgi:hypothetical protein